MRHEWSTGNSSIFPAELRVVQYSNNIWCVSDSLKSELKDYDDQDSDDNLPSVYKINAVFIWLTKASTADRVEKSQEDLGELSILFNLSESCLLCGTFGSWDSELEAWNSNEKWRANKRERKTRKEKIYGKDERR